MNKKRLLVFLLTLIMLASAIPLPLTAADWVPSNVKSVVFDSNYYASRYSDLRAAFGTDASKLYAHYLNYGAKEGRQASPLFCSSYYTLKNTDLKAAFGSDYTKGVSHFGSHGYKESGRVTAACTDLGKSFEARITASTGMSVTISGTNVVINKPVSQSKAQTWIFTQHSDGSYTIKNKNTNQVLDVACASAASGANVQIYESNNSNAQRWYVFKYSTNKYVLRSKATPSCVLNVNGGSNTAGTNVNSSTYNGSNAQFFSITKIDSTIENSAPINLGNDFHARIMGVASEKYVVANSNSNAVINSAASNDLQIWQFVRNSDGSYTILNEQTNKALDVSAGNYKAGTNILTYSSNSTNAQRWFIYESNGHYILSPKCAPECVMDIAGNGKTNGTNVQIYTYNGTAAQLFDILPVNGVNENIIWASLPVLTVKAGQSVNLDYYYVQFTSGAKIIPGEDITWTSSNLGIDENNNFIAPFAGNYTVVAKSGSSTIKITISAIEPQTKLYQVAPDANMLLNCYVIKTKNDKLIVVDGGGAGSSTNNKGYLYKTLQEISGKDVPEIEAWILTHLHDDHVNEFNLLVNDSSKKIDIKNVYFNLPSREFMSKSESGGSLYLYDAVKASYDKLFGKGAFDAIGGKNIFEGDTLQIDDVTIDILLTVTDKETESNINDTSIIFRATIDGNTVMFLGDAYIPEGQRLLDKYGSALKSDVVQLAHHGQNGVNQNVYQAIDPDVCLWPTPIWVWNNAPGIYQTPTVRKWMMSLGVKYHYIAGVSLTQSISFPLDYSTMTAVNITP